MSLDPALHNFKVWKATSWKKVLTWYTDTTLATPQDLTGYTALMEIRAQPTDSTVLYTMTNSNGKIILGGSVGTIQLIIPSADTANFTWTTASYHLYVTDGAGNTDMLLYGGINVVTA